MTREDLKKQIAEKTGIDSNDVSAVVEAALTLIKDNVARGENIYLRGFGSFELVKVKEKKARNIGKGTECIVPEHHAPKFYPSDMFKVKVLKVTNGLG